MVSSADEIKEEVARDIRKALSHTIGTKPSSVAEVKKALDAALTTMHDIKILDVKFDDRNIVYTIQQSFGILTISWSLDS